MNLPPSVVNILKTLQQNQIIIIVIKYKYKQMIEMQTNSFSGWFNLLDTSLLVQSRYVGSRPLAGAGYCLYA